MKRKIFLLGALALCLTGCGQEQAKTQIQVNKRQSKAKANATAKRIIKYSAKAEENKVITEPLFSKDDKGDTTNANRHLCGEYL